MISLSTSSLSSFSAQSLSFLRELSKSNEPPDPDAHLVGENESRLLDTSGAEELSVKTLADMFDFRVGEQVNTF